MNSNYALQLANIARKFGSEFVLKDISLDLPVGESLVLFGGNGAGKTTLLRVLAGLLSPSRGEGRIFGYDLKDRRSVREHVFLMAEGGLYADLTVAENLKFTAQMYSVKPQTERVLETVDLPHAVNKRARELSSGMRKRVQLARMLLAPSQLILADEPFANLDEAGREVVQEQLKNMQKAGKTVLFTSHEPKLARQVATQEYRLVGGVLQ